MQLRSGAQIAQSAKGSIVPNPTAFQTIAQRNASSPFLMLPQEIKNRIYYFVCGGHMVHILQVDCNHNHAHGKADAKLSHTLCIEPTSEEQTQKSFDSADPDTGFWNISLVEDRHVMCHQPSATQRRGPDPNQLSLTLLRSCRQIYLEANKAHYKNNTFAITCNDTLERFVKARFQNKQHLAIRSLYLDVCISHSSSVDAWSDSINKALLKRLKSVRDLNLNLTQLYCACTIDVSGYEDSEMTNRQFEMFKEFGKLPLQKVTLLIDDREFLEEQKHHHPQSFIDQIELSYRWTLKQKQDFSRDVRDALLTRGDAEKGD